MNRRRRRRARRLISTPGRWLVDVCCGSGVTSMVCWSRCIPLDRELSRQIGSLARRHDATLFMTLYAGLAILLSRLSGQQDIVVGTPVANRQRLEIEDLIGFFVNTLALRVQLEDELTIAEVLE